MYGIFTYIWLVFMVNVGKYTIHGCYLYGLYMSHECLIVFNFINTNCRDNTKGIAMDLKGIAMDLTTTSQHSSAKIVASFQKNIRKNIMERNEEQMFE